MGVDERERKKMRIREEKGKGKLRNGGQVGTYSTSMVGRVYGVDECGEMARKSMEKMKPKET